MKEFWNKGRQWLADHGTGLLLAVVLAVGVYFLAAWVWPARGAAFVLAMLAGLAAAVHFGHCFTRDLPETKGAVAPELRAVFRYAYVFLGFALLGSLSPFFAPKDLFTASDTWAGVADGCLVAEAGYGSELTRCDEDGSDQQWLIHIGSRVTPERVFDAQGLAELAGAAQAACADSDGWARVRAGLEARGRADGAALVAELQAACPDAARDMAAVLRERGVTAGEHAKLSRGLVVPLYVVVLAVFGGAVGMSRRIPEIQRAAAASAKAEEPDTAISAIVARERVVFQIMQVLSAPLIAIAAFAAFEPDTMTAAVLIGFVSGFTSETILVKLRQAGEAVVGRQPPKARAEGEAAPGDGSRPPGDGSKAPEDGGVPPTAGASSGGKENG